MRPASSQVARLHLSESRVASAGCFPAIAAEVAASNLYPDPDCTELTAALARHWDLETGSFAVGNGSDELILLCALALGDASRPGVVSAGSFAGHRFALEIARREVREVPLADGYVDASAFARALDGASIGFLCTPHNPSGVALSQVELEEVARAAAETGATLVVDEAYMEFAPYGTPSATALVPARARIVALRTFSKAYGLAGVRVGYAIASMRQAAALRHAQRVLPFRVNRLGQVAALAALEDRACIERVRCETAGKRAWFTGALRAQGFLVHNSSANFVAVRVDDPATLCRRLLNDHGIAVRDTSDMGYPNHVRISLGTSAELERVLAALGTGPSATASTGLTPSDGRRTFPATTARKPGVDI